MSLSPQVRWQVQDVTSRNLLQVGPQDVGFLCRVLAGSGSMHQAIKGGVGAGCWELDSDALPKASFQVPVTLADGVDLVGANGAIVYWTAPCAGTLVKVYAVINGAITTGSAVLTGKIGSTAITGGVVTCLIAASAAGSVFSATPSALNVLAAGDVLSFTVSGTQDATKLATITALFTPTV